MSTNEIVEKINELLSHIKLYDDITDLFSHQCINHYKLVDGVGYTIVLDIKHIEIYRTVLSALYSTADIKKNYNYKTIESLLHDFFLMQKINNQNVDEKVYLEFLHSIIDKTKKTFSVFHRMYGVTFTSNMPLKQGCFTIYNVSKHKKEILEKISVGNSVQAIKELKEFNTHEIWVCVDVETIDEVKAKEVARIQLQALQGSFQLFLDKNKYNAHIVTVAEEVHITQNRYYVFSNTEISEGYENSGIMPQDLDIEFFIKSNPLFTTTAELLSGDSEISMRIINSLANYSRTIFQHTQTEKFLSFITAIESLIEFDGRKIKENTAKHFAALLTTKKEEYCVLKQYFRFNYKLRSEIAHGDRIDIMKGDLEYAKCDAVNLIIAFVKNNDIKKYRTNAELKSYLDDISDKMEVTL